MQTVSVFPQALTKFNSHSGTVPVDSYGYLKYSESNGISCVMENLLKWEISKGSLESMSSSSYWEIVSWHYKMS